MMQKLRHHPDLGGDPSVAQALNLAMETLSDPVRRAAYDRELTQSRQPSASSAAGGTPGASTSASTSNGATGRKTEGRSAGNSHQEVPENSGSKQRSYQDKAVQPPHTWLPQRPHCLFCGATRASSAAARLPYAVENLCLRCDAPVTPIDELAPSLSDELRRLNRYELAGTVTLWAQWPKDKALHGSLQDLSLAGCAVGCNHPLTGNSLILLEAQLLSAVCQVRYCKPDKTEGGFQVGLQFQTLTLRAQPGAVFSTVA